MVKIFWLKHKSTLVSAGAILLFYFLLFALGITCPIKYLTGISCPGCGMSRAYFSLFRLDLNAAFDYHPLWPFVFPVIGSLVFFHTKQKKQAFRVILILALSTMFLTFLIRMFLGNGNVVVYAPENGIVYRIVQKLVSLFS